MTVLERRKYKLIRAILNDTDLKRLKQIEKLYFDENPLSYSVEELNESLRQIEKDLENGTMKFYTSEQLRRHVVWYYLVGVCKIWPW